MRLHHRLQLLERHRPRAAMPEHITIVRGRDDNPDIPDNFFPCELRILSRDADGAIVEEFLPAAGAP